MGARIITEEYVTLKSKYLLLLEDFLRTGQKSARVEIEGVNQVTLYHGLYRWIITKKLPVRIRQPGKETYLEYVEEVK